MTDTLTPEKREAIEKRVATDAKVRVMDEESAKSVNQIIMDRADLLSALEAAEARLSEALEALGLMLREHDILSGNFGDVMDPKHRRPDRWPTAAESARRALAGGKAENEWLKHALDAAIERAEKAEAESSVGWLFLNPDTGIEFNVNHPVESGEAPDAKNITPATARALVHLLTEEWRDVKARESELTTLRARVAELEGALAVARPYVSDAEAFNEGEASRDMEIIHAAIKEKEPGNDDRERREDAGEPTGRVDPRAEG